MLLNCMNKRLNSFGVGPTSISPKVITISRIFLQNYQNNVGRNSSLCNNKLFSTNRRPISKANTFRRSFFYRVRTIKSESNKKPKSLNQRGPVTWKSLAALAVAGGFVIAYVKYLKDEKEKQKQIERSRAVGMAALGGPYELIDQDGNPKSDKDFHGQWVLLYFGFTHCPDICPDQLDKMGNIIQTLDGTKGIPKIQPLFVSVDPYRDDPKSIKEYLKEFHPRLIGLTGSEEQTKKITKAFRVYYSAGPKDEDEDYIVDHTIIMYLIDPNGKFMEYFGQNRTETDIVTTIANRMITYKHT